MAEPWTNGIRDAVAALVGGDAIEAGARSAEEERLLKARSARALLENRMLKNADLVQMQAANKSLDGFDFDPQTLAIMRAKLGSQFAGATRGGLNQQQLTGNEAAMEAALAGDWGTMNAIKAANAAGPSPVFAVSGGREAENRYLPYGGATRDTPLAMQQIEATRALEQQREAAAALTGVRAELAPRIADAQIANYRETPSGRGKNERRKSLSEFLTEYGLSKNNPAALAAWQEYNDKFNVAGAATTTVSGTPVATGKPGATNGPPAKAVVSRVPPAAAIAELKAAVKAGDAAAAAEFESYFGVPAKPYLQ